MTSSTNDSSVWSLSVKAIGSALKHCTSSRDERDEELNSSSFETEKNFTVTVSPEDGVTSLYDQIEGITGLKASQQRLIYRGRLIENKELKSEEAPPSSQETEEPKIKDISGLADGHTIHLVKRESSDREASSEGEASSTANAATSTTAATARDESSSLSGNASSSLLAALIGLGGLEDDSTTTSANAAPGRRWRSSRLGRSRRPHYRLTTEDLQIPDPGSLEPVRQGLMTIHTMLPHAEVNAETDGSGTIPSPLDANRTWYKGQWIDCRDTVNCWLEATIVDIVPPEEILPPNPEADKLASERPQRILEPATDPAVGAGDLEGRRHLLLEPCDERDEGDEGGELAGFRRRKTNAGVKLLLVHYNGWPHCWDEWIRSDSERIRPFRTRTRHPSMPSHSSPTVQTVYNDSPATNIRDEDNSVERSALLPELSRAVTAVNDLLSAVASEESAQLTSEQREDLPWAVRTGGEEIGTDDDDLDHKVEEGNNIITNIEQPDTGDRDHSSSSSASVPQSDTQSRLRRRQLEMLAPLLDRLGRTLIDAAPHVSSLAQSLQDSDTEESISTNEAVATAEPVNENPSTLGGLLSLLGRDRQRRSSSTPADAPPIGATEQSWPVDPDYVDFATGPVNTTRGEVRSGPRSRSSSDDMAGLLGSYLAAASLGLTSSGDSDGNGDNASNILSLSRLLRDRGSGGSNGGGIDIHIHAVVTSPGMAPTTIGAGGGEVATGEALGFTGLPATTMINNAGSPRMSLRGNGSSLLRMRQTPIVMEEDEDLGLFDELYSENPAPVDPNSSPEPGSEVTNDGAPDADLLRRLSGTSRSQSSPNISRDDPITASPNRRIARSRSGEAVSRSSAASPGLRRGSMLGRLFRRGRRSNG